MIWPLIQLGFWGPLISGFGRVAGTVVAGFLCAGTFWVLTRRRRWAFGALALTTGAGHVLLCYVGLDYQPRQSLLPLATYYATFSILVFAAVFATGILAVARRLVSGRRALRCLLTVAVVGNGAGIAVLTPRALALEAHWIHRQAYESPETFVRALDEASRFVPGCTAVDTEELFYAVLLFGDYSRPVSYKDRWGEGASFEIGPSRDECTFLLTTRKCFDRAGFTTLREGDFVLARRDIRPATRERTTR